jgi:hypothetical protein
MKMQPQNKKYPVCVLTLEKYQKHKNRPLLLDSLVLHHLLGIAGGAFQCYWTYTHVPLEKQPLCIVLDDEDAVFGPGGTFLRLGEVDMEGLG